MSKQQEPMNVLAMDAEFTIVGTASGNLEVVYKGERYATNGRKLNGGRAMNDAILARAANLFPEAREAQARLSAYREEVTERVRRAGFQEGAKTAQPTTPQAPAVDVEKVRAEALEQGKRLGAAEVRESKPTFGSQLEAFMVESVGKLTAESVAEKVMPELLAHAKGFVEETYGVLPTRIEVKTPTETREMNAVTHEAFEDVVAFIAADEPVFLTGPAGSGKNVLIQQAAEAVFGPGRFCFSNAVTQEHKLTGFIDAHGKYHETEFYRAFTEGHVFFLDEVDASIPEVLVMLNAAIANRYFDFPTGRFDAHPDFRVVAAGNTFGTGADAEYVGRFQLDAASLDRFAQVTVDYSPKIELLSAGNDKALVAFARSFRTACQRAGVRHVVSYRALKRIAAMKDTLGMEKTLRTCLLKSMADEDVRIVREGMRDLDAGNPYMAALRAM